MIWKKDYTKRGSTKKKREVKGLEKQEQAERNMKMEKTMEGGTVGK